MFTLQEKFVNEVLGDVLTRIREVFDKKVSDLHRKKQKISDLKVRHLKEIYEELVKTFRDDFQNYIKGNVKDLKMTNFDYIIEKFVEPHVKWMYKMIKATYHDEHAQPVLSK